MPSVAPMTATFSTGTGGKKILVTCAAIGSFLWAAIMTVLVFLQLVVAETRRDDELAALGYWNLVIVAVYVVLGIGIFARKKWAWDWGIGSNALNLLLGIYEITQGGWLNVLLLPLELLIVVALYATRAVVAPTRTQYGPGRVASFAPQAQQSAPAPYVAPPAQQSAPAPYVAPPAQQSAPAPYVAPAVTEPAVRSGTALKVALWIGGVLVLIAVVSAALFVGAGDSVTNIWAVANERLQAAANSKLSAAASAGATGGSTAQNATGPEPTITESGQAAQSEASAPVQESASGGTDDGLLASCISEGQTPQLACLSEELDRQDARLNKEYQRVMAQYKQLGQGDSIAVLRKVELEWIKHVQSECDTTPPDFMGNPDRRRIDCRLDVTKARADELAKMPQ